MNTTTENTNSTANRPGVANDPDPSRCRHLFANGKRCRLPGSHSQRGFCLRHFSQNALADSSRQKAHDDAEDLSADLLGLPSERSSAMELKQFLSRLLHLVAKGRISPRRAAVLVNITNQLRYSHSAPHR